MMIIPFPGTVCAPPVVGQTASAVSVPVRLIYHHHRHHHHHYRVHVRLIHHQPCGPNFEIW